MPVPTLVLKKLRYPHARELRCDTGQGSSVSSMLFRPCGPLVAAAISTAVCLAAAFAETVSDYLPNSSSGSGQSRS